MDEPHVTAAARKADDEPIRSWGIWNGKAWIRDGSGRYFYYLSPGPAIAQAREMAHSRGDSFEAREFPIE
jgi:hypothetical protein